MNAKQNDTTDTVAVPRRRAPRPRAESAAARVTPARHAKAQREFEARAQQVMLDRPGRLMRLPDDLAVVTKVGVPCKDCGALIYRDRDAGHRVEWKRVQGQHWAAGITTSCPAR